MPDDPAGLDEPADELDDDAERLPAEDLLPEELPDDALPAAPDEARELGPAEAAAAELWVEPGSVAAMAPAAMTLAAPTPAVTADSRLMPRRLSIDGGTGRPPGLLGIGDSFPWLGGPAPPPRWRRAGWCADNDDASASTGAAMAQF